MAINISSMISGAQVRTVSSTYQPDVSDRVSASEPLRISAIQDFHRRAGGLADSLVSMRDTLLGLRDDMKTGKAASVASGLALQGKVETTATEIVQEATRTTLFSGGAIEAGMAGFSTQRPEWEGASTSDIRIRGRYTGEEDDSLTFTVIAEATQRRRGALEVTNGAGEVVETLSFNRRDNRMNMDNGLRLLMDHGVGAALGDSFQVDVRPGTGDVDPDARFRGRSDQLLITDPRIKPGSFEVNGVEIQVRGQDSINSVLNKINRSSAGVNAHFNKEDQTIELRSQSLGETEITLERDTSNFLAAMKLNEPNYTLGQDQVTREVTTYEDVDAVDFSPGNFFINGVEVRIKADDSVRDVIDRINGSGTGALARLDRDGELTIRSRSKGGTLTLTEGSAGFFSAVDIEEGVYRGRGSSGLSFNQAGEVLDGFVTIGSDASAVYDAVDGEEHASTELKKFRNQLDKVLSRALEEADSGVKDAVKGIFGEEVGADFFDLSASEEKDLTTALRKGSKDLMGFLLGEEDDKDGMGGVLGDLLYKLSDQGEALGNLHGHKGIVINIAA